MSIVTRRVSKAHLDDSTSTVSVDQDPAQEVQFWLQKTPRSIGTLRLLLCADLTVVQSALLSSWAFVAWVLGLSTVDLHQLTMYGGLFCLQYLLLSVVRFFHVLLDSWNNNQNWKTVLRRPFETAVNVSVRLLIWLVLMGVALFSGFQLRVLPMHSFINCVISGCAFGNFVLLLHTSGAILTDCHKFIQSSTSGERRSSRTVVVRMSIGVWTMVIRTVIVAFQGVHLVSHLWPLADTMLVSCLVALGVYMSRRSLDEAWFTSHQVKNARIVAQESRHLIWPTVILLAHYLCDVIMSIVRLTHECALKFLISLSKISVEKEDNIAPFLL